MIELIVNMGTIIQASIIINSWYTEEMVVTAKTYDCFQNRYIVDPFKQNQLGLLSVLLLVPLRHTHSRQHKKTRAFYVLIAASLREKRRNYSPPFFL